MLMITEAAGELLAELLADAEAPEGVVARFIQNDGELALTLSETQPDDVGFEHEGNLVLALDEEMSGVLESHVLDVEETDEGPQLALGVLEVELDGDEQQEGDESPA